MKKREKKKAITGNFCIKTPVRFKENVPLTNPLPQGLIFDCKSNKRAEETSAPTKNIRSHISSELARRQRQSQKWCKATKNEKKKKIKCMETKLCKTPFVQRLTRKNRHCTKSFNAVQQRKDSTSSPCFPRTLLLLRLFFYDLAKVLHTFSLQWLIYNHVVAIYTHTQKK